MTQDKPATTAASTSPDNQVNKGPLCYGVPVENWDKFEHWLTTTAWPEQHDQAIMFLRSFCDYAANDGLILQTFKVEITDGKTRFISTSVDGRPIDLREWCYRVKFTPQFPQDAVVMFSLYFPYDPQHPDQRTTGCVPIWNRHDPSLIVAEDL